MAKDTAVNIFNNSNIKFKLIAQANSFIDQFDQSNSSLSYRKKSLDKFIRQGIPNSQKHEDWKYTDFAHINNHIEKDELKLSTFENHAHCIYSANFLNIVQQYVDYLIDIYSDEKLICLVLLDGVFRKDLSATHNNELIDNIYSINNIIDSSELDPLNNTNTTRQDLDCNIVNISNNVDNCKDIDLIDLSDLVNAVYTDGLYINLNNNKVNAKKIKYSIRVINIYTENSHNSIVNNKVICKLGEETELDLVEHYLYLNSESIQLDSNKDVGQLLSVADSKSQGLINSNINFNIILSECAKLMHTILQDQDENTYHISNYRIWQHKNSVYTNHNFNFGGKISRQDIIAEHLDEHAESNFFGLFVPTGKQHMDTHIKALHKQSHGISRQDYRGVLDDHSHGVFNGLIYVEKGTVNNNSNQSSKNLLLSKNAQVDAKPELQIYSEDVVAAHGATIGQIDHKALFYLQSRGINKQDAIKLLIFAFCQHIIHHLKDKNTTLWVNYKLSQKLNDKLG